MLFMVMGYIKVKTGVRVGRIWDLKIRNILVVLLLIRAIQILFMWQPMGHYVIREATVVFIKQPTLVKPGVGYYL